MASDVKVYNADAVANAFIRLAQQNGEKLTNLQLQKLVYIAHGWCLATLDKSLIKNDVHAFEFGPVIPTLYNKLKKYGAKPVTETIPTDNPELREEGQAMSVVKKVWSAYGSFDGLKLSAITHKDDTPWREVWERNKYGIIPPEIIKKHYQQLLNERADIAAEPAF